MQLFLTTTKREGEKKGILAYGMLERCSVEEGGKMFE